MLDGESMSLSRGLFGICAAVLFVACEGNVDSTTGGGASGGSGGEGGSGGNGGTGTSTGGGASTSTNTGGTIDTTISTGTGGRGGGTGDCVTGPDEDADQDGFSANEGDCNDCNPDQNPGAVELVATEPGPGGDFPAPADEDCDGVVDNVDPPCDDGLPLDDGDPFSGARAIELCQTEDPFGVKWGVLQAAYVRANGVGAPLPLQRGIKAGFGPNVNPQGGKSLLVLSSGHARAAADPDACGATSCSLSGAGTAPPGFPLEVPGCEGSPQINDDIALELQIRVPTNAEGYSFDFKLHSFEYPQWVCTEYNDQFIALISPAPPGSIAGNVSFTDNGPVGVNMGLFDVCDPATLGDWASYCSAGCPPAPSPYCASGTGELAGTGFAEWDAAGHAGATSWLRTSAPVLAGSTITVRLAIWDAGDQSLDSTILLDHWQWVSNKTVPVATEKIADPK